MIASLPVQATLWNRRLSAGAGGSILQLRVVGLYEAPSPKPSVPSSRENPPQTIISVPVQTAVWETLPLTGGSGRTAQESLEGSYAAPVAGPAPPELPHTIISLPVHTAVWPPLRSGEPAIGRHLSARGS